MGDTRAVREAIEFSAQNKLGLLQLLPVNETGDDNSPYNAISSVALDPLYLHMVPDEVPGLTEEILREMVPDSLRDELQKGPVQYRRSSSSSWKFFRAPISNLRRSIWKKEPIWLTSSRISWRPTWMAAGLHTFPHPAQRVQQQPALAGLGAGAPGSGHGRNLAGPGGRSRGVGALPAVHRLCPMDRLAAVARGARLRRQAQGAAGGRYSVWGQPLRGRCLGRA